jgi:hypothetical protein
MYGFPVAGRWYSLENLLHPAGAMRGILSKSDE